MELNFSLERLERGFDQEYLEIEEMAIPRSKEEELQGFDVAKSVGRAIGMDNKMGS